MNNSKKLAAARKAYELDTAGQLWTKPRGAKPITQDAVLVVVDGLTYRVETDAIKTALQPKHKRRKKCSTCKNAGPCEMDCNEKTKGKL